MAPEKQSRPSGAVAGSSRPSKKQKSTSSDSADQDTTHCSMQQLEAIHQLPETGTDADQYARPDHSSVRHYNLIQGETSAHENLFDGFEPYNDWSQHPLITATVHYQAISEEQVAQKIKELEKLIAGKASLREGIVVVCSLIRVVRRFRTG